MSPLAAYVNNGVDKFTLLASSRGGTSLLGKVLYGAWTKFKEWGLSCGSDLKKLN